MKRIQCAAALLLVCLLFAACGGGQYEDMSTGTGGGTPTLVRGDTTYVFYGFVANGALTGKQIGILDGDKNHKVYEVKGYPGTDWLLTELDVLMESGYSLYRAEHVEEIPADFALDSDPDSHFLANYQ